MPILNVKVSAPRSPALTQAIAEMLLTHTATILQKKRDVTAIALDYISPDDWIIAGQALSAQHKNSFYLTIKITDETNTKAEKAAYIAAVFAGFDKLLGNLHPESYIHVEDVRAAAYGFGGKTQEYRFQHTA